MTNDIKIGLWGAPSSGKTTFIGALEVAAANTADIERWKIIPRSPEAADYIRDRGNELVVEKTFPQAGLTKTDPLRWQFIGEPQSKRRSRLIEFELELIDAPGGFFKARRDPDLIKYLAKCDGLVFLFDPTTETAEGGAQTAENFTHFKDTLSEIAGQARLNQGFLPHHIAVCVTKLDDPAFFQHAREAGWINQDRDGVRLPRVHAEQSEKFFQWVCERISGTTASLVRKNIKSYFHHNRTHYFATSSVGFRANAENIVDINDCLNLNTRNGEPEIIQGPNPVNVLEPLVWLEKSIREGRP